MARKTNKTAKTTKAADKSVGKKTAAKRAAAKVAKPDKPATKSVKKFETLKPATAKAPTRVAKTDKAVKTAKAAVAKAPVKSVKGPKTVKGSKTRKAALSVAPATATPAKKDVQAIVEDQEKIVQSAEDGAMSEEELLKAKSGLKKRDLEHYHQVLMEKRAEIIGDVSSLEDARNHDKGGDHFSPEHMADIGSDNWEMEFNLTLVESERRTLTDINSALMRMAKGYYGVCIETGKPIGKPRLDAKPWAKYCIDVVRDRERRGLR